MVKFKRIAVACTGIVALATVAAGSWTLADDLGIRPVLTRDMVARDVQIATITTEVLWLRFRQLDRTKGYRELTPRECAEYRGLAKQLNLPVPPC